MDQNREQFSPEFEKFMEKYLEKRVELKRAHITVFNVLAALIIGSLGLIAALAWDEFLKKLLIEIFHGHDSLATDLTYAILVTVIAVLAAIFLGKSGEGKKE